MTVDPAAQSSSTPPVCVAGMHRSGTSMIARILNLGGLYLGKPADLWGAVQYNADGLWEHREFVALNDEILSAIGAAWDHPEPLPRRWTETTTLAPLKARSAALVAAFDGLGAWGWKDPRNSLTLRFWQTVTGRLKVILCVRHPLEVALSLQARNSFSSVLSLDLWKTYNARVVEATQPGDRLVTHYDAYFDNPRGEIQRLLDFAGLDASPQSIDACASGIADRLRHHRVTAVDFAAAELASDLADLYRQLLVEGGRPADVPMRKMGAKKVSHRRSPAHASASARSDAPRVNALVMDLLRERDDLRAAVAATDTALAAKEAALGAMEIALTQRDLAYRELAIETHTLRHELDNERRERARLQEAIDESSRQSTQETMKAAEYEQVKRRLYDLLDDTVPRGATVLMVSRGDDALLHLNGRDVSHFPRTREGAWNGHPADSQDAIDQLETIRKTGRAYLVLPAATVWWLQHYGHLRTYLEQRGRLVANQEAIALVFELSAPAIPAL